MATQAYPFFQITDGTTSCTIQDGSGGATNYPLVRDGWAPSVAGLRASPLTGYTPYEDVVETFTIEINGATATAALANLATLSKLLDQAARWYRGENVTAVLLKIAPHGSTVSATATPLQAAILGGAVGGAGVRLSPRWDEVGRNYVIPNVEVSVLRRGLWLHTTTEANSPAAANNGELVTFTLTARDTKCPVRVQLTNFGYGYGSKRFLSSFLLLGEPVGGSAPIAIINAEDGTGGGGTYTSVAGGLNARNTNVLRYTPAATTEVLTNDMSATLPTATNLVAVFVNVRPSATVACVMRCRISSEIIFQYSPLVTIPANADTYPYWVFLGLIPKEGAIANVRLAVTAASASSSIDIDSIVLCDARAVQVLALIGPGDDAQKATAATTATLDVNHRLLSNASPSAFDGTVPVPYAGDAVFCNNTASLYGLLLGTGGGTSATGQEFRQADTTADTVLQNTWTVTRSTAYLVPQ